VSVSSGESLKIIRELQNLTQKQLAKKVGISQGAISLIENDLRSLEIKRLRQFARALYCHPSVLTFLE
jgi:transcriptional regulator with XRE-family HTH domain